KRIMGHHFLFGPTPVSGSDFICPKRSWKVQYLVHLLWILVPLILKSQAEGSTRIYLTGHCYGTSYVVHIVLHQKKADTITVVMIGKDLLQTEDFISIFFHVKTCSVIRKQ